MNAPNWERVKEVFQDALDVPPTERAKWLRARCREDRALQAEVESLLASHEHVGSFAEHSPLAAPSVIGGAYGALDFNGRALTRGTRLGVYEIESLLGTGGMGEVYKARDTRLDRTVAIKVLPAHFAADRDRYDRFQREARAVAILDHPHIGALYDVGEHEHLHFLVMQYLEGETLAARLRKGRLPIDLVLRYAIEIAEALDHAHRRGIVHRDLKPGNIVLTKTGAKLLDFGLAKWRTDGAHAVADVQSQNVTVPKTLTEQGLIVGTLQYMAPEQLQGKTVDARTDIFAFGVVLHEIVTGQKAFARESTASVIAAILDAQPPMMSTVNARTPPLLDHVVAICLAKDPEARWQSIADVARQIRWIGERATAETATPALRGSTRTVRTILIAVAAVIVGAIVGAVAWSRSQPVPVAMALHVTRAIIPLPPGTSLDPGNPVVLSPDGTRLAYVAAHGDVTQLYVQALDQFDAKPIAGTEGALLPFFSPDSRWLAFSVRGTLKKVAVSGGAPQVICNAEGGVGATWGSDDTIVFATRFYTGLSRCAASGGAPQRLTTPDASKKEKSHRWPQFLPGASAVLFNIVPADITAHDEAKIAVLSLDSGQIRVVLDGGRSPRYVKTGHLVYLRAGSLVAVPFDPDRLEVLGGSTSVADGISSTSEDGAASFSVSDSGSLAFVSGDTRGIDRRVVWVDRHGTVEPLIDLHRPFGSVKLAPDGKRLAVSISAANDQLWIYDLARRMLTPLTVGWDNDVDSWTPDGQRIVFRSARGGDWNFYVQRADGSGPVERLTESPHAQGNGSWSPDGKIFVFHEGMPLSHQALRRLDMASHTVTALRSTPTPFLEQQPAISPDGRWLAYVSTESGSPEIFVQSFPSLSQKWRISADGGTTPMWDPHGRELYYQNGGKMMAVAVETRSTFTPGTARLLFGGDYFAGSWKNYDIAPDGRFIMIQTGRTHAPQTQIAIVHNWFAELRQRVSTSQAR